MSVLIVADMRVYHSDGRYYLAEQHYHIVKRYSDSFGKIELYARLCNEKPSLKVINIDDCVNSVNGAGSLSEIFKRDKRAVLRECVRGCDLVIGRLHSVFGCLASAEAKKQGKPYFAEVMGDAFDAYWNHGIVGKLVAPFMYFAVKRVVWNADFALYVTNEYLQKRYPCKNESIGASNVLIKDVDPTVLEKRLEKIAVRSENEIKLMTSAAVDVKFKGQEYVIRAIPAINKAGYKVKYYLAGGGSQDYLRSVAEKCGVSEQVVFLGRLTLGEVIERLDEIDIYIQPSLQEGLPRAVIEAMSRGCPAIGAKTAGIPELIPAECVVRRKSPGDIANTVLNISSAEKLAQLAQINFEKSKEYLDSVLSVRREEYFSRILKSIQNET